MHPVCSDITRMFIGDFEQVHFKLQFPRVYLGRLPRVGENYANH